MKKGQQGVTLTELLSAIGTLADVVLPAYKTSTDKAKFSGVVVATSMRKLIVKLCYSTYVLMASVITNRSVNWSGIVTPHLTVNT